jgi:hypothetical protein
MHIPETFFKNAEGVIDWHKTHYPDSCDKYIAIKEKIKASKFPGSASLLRNLESNKTVTGFLSFLTEVNLADLFLKKSVSDLAYEPKHIPGIDFTFDDIAISVKNLHPKNYEKSEQETIDTLRTAGGGKTSLTHKNFSSIDIEVKKTEMGTYGWERMETGYSGFLDSDLYEMSAPLSYIGELEQTDTGEHKRVLFFFIQSDEFAQYYIYDIVFWYFGYVDDKYHPIFHSDMDWYDRLLKTAPKKNKIDAIVFMYAPQTLLSWPDGCLAYASDKAARVQIYAREKATFDQLKAIFS